MDSKFITLIQKFCWFVSFLILLTAAANIGLQIYGYFSAKADLNTEREFYFLNLARFLFSALSQAFLLFLVSSIFETLFQHQPADSKQTDLFLILTCVGFVGEGILDVVNWVQASFYILPQVDFFKGQSILAAVVSLMRIFSCLTSFLYAIIIFILYRFFSRSHTSVY